ncbi:MAG: hypothetical protein ACTS73_09890 [Arsenophonus sp. NEOnobi-MAG3]
MKKFTIHVSAKQNITCDLLHELILNDIKHLIATAVENELEGMLQQYVERRLLDRPHAVVINGYFS